MGQKFVMELFANRTQVSKDKEAYLNSFAATFDMAASFAALAPTFNKYLAVDDAKSTVALTYLLVRLPRVRLERPSQQTSTNKEIWDEVWKIAFEKSVVKQKHRSLLRGQAGHAEEWRESVERYSERHFRRSMRTLKAAEGKAKLIKRWLESLTTENFHVHF